MDTVAARRGTRRAGAQRGTTSRSTLTAIAAALTAAALAGAPAAEAKPRGFAYGVTAGDVDSHSAILWAKAQRPGTALIQIGAGGFARCPIRNAPRRLLVAARKRRDNTVQKRVGGLRPDTLYRYRFCKQGGARSEVGRFRTAPRPRQRRTIHFALSGDQDARPLPGQTEPYWNDFGVWDEIAKQDNDFNVLLGDTIYSDTEVPGYGLADVALTTEQKRDAYRLNLSRESWVEARGSAAYYAHWDDHEFINDFSRFEDHFPLSVGDVNLDGETLYRRGRRAFRDYNPVAYDKRTGLYRSVRWGRNLEVFFLDERSFRSAGADYTGACDNPPASGDPDLAPTAPQDVRDAFAGIAPPLANPVAPACLAAINDPGRTMLGRRQLTEFKRAIKRSRATFKVIFNEVPIQQFYALPYDRWEGYAVEREALLGFLQRKTDNVIFLTTDVHANLVNDARFNTLGPAGVRDSGILEVTTGPVATGSYATEINTALGVSSAGPLVHDLFFKPQPPAGLGMRCAGLDQFSYAEVKVSGSAIKIDLLDGNDQPVEDTGKSDNFVSQPLCPRIIIPKR